MTTTEEPRRRSEDVNRELYGRLDHLERENAALRTEVGTLTGSQRLMTVEMSHLKEIFEARMRILEKGQDLIGSQVAQISKDLTVMTSEPEKSPMGRGILTLLELTDKKCEENKTAIEEKEGLLADLSRWQNQVDGAILLLKFFGAAGMISLAVTIFKLIKGTL